MTHKNKDMTFKEVLGKVEPALKLLGWRGGNDFQCWKDGDEYVLAFEPMNKKKPSQKTIKKLLKLFNAKEPDWIDFDAQFISIILNGEK